MKIDHIAIAVDDLSGALETWRSLYGVEPETVEEIPTEKLTEAMLPFGDSYVQLLHATDPASTIAKFVEKRGPGLHHIALRVPDVEAAMKSVAEGGGRLLDETPRIGGGGHRVAFVHPKSTAGVLIELVENAE